MAHDRLAEPSKRSTLWVRSTTFIVIMPYLFQIAWADWSWGTLGLIVFAIGFGQFVGWADTRIRPPGQYYWRLALASFLIGWLFLSISLMSDAPVWPATILWAGMTLLGAIWVVFYNRTEPRS